MKDEIIRLIKRNRISTTEVSDCLEKTGVFDGALPLNRSKIAVGEIHYAYVDGESNWNLHKCIRDVKEGSVVLVDDLGSNGRASFGELVAKYLILYNQIEGIVSNTKVRDAHALIKENYPIWCAGVSPVGCYNSKPMQPVSDEIVKKRMKYFNEAVAVCDDAGVIVITKDRLNREFYEKLEMIERLEDEWFDKLDRLKLNTFEIVCGN